MFQKATVKTRGGAVAVGELASAAPATSAMQSARQRTAHETFLRITPKTISVKSC
jgi:hypothetical protein